MENLNQNCLIYHYSCMIAIMFIGGAIGGIARGSSDRLNSGIVSPKDYSYSTWRNINRRLSFWLQHAFLGVAGGSSAIFLTLMFSKYTLNISDLQSLTLYSSIAVLGGVMAKRCLPVLGERISKEIEQKVKAENKNIEIRVNSMERNLADVETELTYRQLIDVADRALSDKNPIIINNAIEKMEKAFAEHGVDRQYAIKLGRLYRRLAENVHDREFHRIIEKAILTLEKFIKILEERGIDNNEVNSAIGTAYFNIACYKVLCSRKADDSQREFFIRESIAMINKAFEYSPYLKVPAKSDPDLKEIWDKINLD